jgi:ribA/ribD-fused uncharacterized protein
LAAQYAVESSGASPLLTEAGRLLAKARDFVADHEERIHAACVNHKLDSNQQVFFYEQEFYVLSNFSSFALVWRGKRFDTSEAAYHWEKFPGEPGILAQILGAMSAHDSYKIAETNRARRRRGWDDVKVGVMRDILRAKVEQHEYVRRKLLETGDRELIEDSWRDDFWGWGQNRYGENMLGRLWMDIRSEQLFLNHRDT